MFEQSESCLMTSDMVSGVSSGLRNGNNSIGPLLSFHFMI